MVFVNSDTAQEVSTGAKLRTLDGMEERFWLMENTLPRTTMVLAEVEGPTTVSAWKDALRKVRQRYPLFSIRVRKELGQRPYFEALNVKIPLKVIPLEGVNLDALVAQEPVISFGYAAGPQARVTLCHSPERCAILFSAHHLASDGLTNVQIVRDLIAAAAGETLGAPFSLLPGLGELFGLREPGPYATLSPVKAPPSESRHSLPAPKVQRCFSLRKI